MRLFTGLDVPYELRRNLELLLQLLRPQASINWSPLENLHITTKFIGEWPQTGLDELKSALEQVPRVGDIKIVVRGIGWFPNPHSPRVLFTSVSGEPKLNDLAAAVNAACEGLGIPREEKEYRPHLTLARIRNPEALIKLKQTIAGLPSVDFGAFTATQHHLYLSEPKGSRSVYTKLASYPLS